MAFTFKDFDKSYQRQEVEENHDFFKVKSQDLSVANSFEILEMQEEEKYIQNIRQQRMKIEQFKSEVLKKDKKIKALEEEILKMRQEFHTYKKISGTYQEMNEKVKITELENENLREKMKKQVEEYEFSLCELQSLAQKDSEDKGKEIRNLKGKLREKEKNAEMMQEEISELLERLKRTEESYEIDSKSVKEREKALQEQVKAWKNFEKMLKDQVSELAHEKNLLQDQVIDLKSQLDHLKTSQINEEVLESEWKKCFDLRKDLHFKSDELKNIRRHKEDFMEKAESEIKSLQNELDRAVHLVARQENSIIELRMRKTEDDMAISNLSELLSSKEDDLLRVTKLYDRLQRESEPLQSKSEVKRLISENQHLKVLISEAKLREESLNAERKQISQKKIELYSQRNAEVSRLTEVLDAVISNKS